MEVKESEKLNNIKKQPSAIMMLFNEFKKKKEDEKFKKHKSKTYWAGIIAGIIVIAGVYFITPGSKVKAIVVNGNYYVSDDLIKDAAGVSLKSRYYLVISPWAQKKVKELDLIDTVKVQHKDNKVIYIEVTEKQPFGYRFVDDTPDLLLTDGSVLPLTSDKLSVVAELPMITGFLEEEATASLAKAFSKLNRREIEAISEVNQYNLNYDDHTLECVMMDGNFFFSSYFGLPILANYFTMTSELEEKGACIFADDNLTIAYKKACPWDEMPTYREYWYDEQGNVIIDKYGDMKVKHYYKDANGFFFLDKEGNKIPIPIDENAEEHPMSIDDLLRWIAGEIDQDGNELNPDGTIKTEEQKALEKLEQEAREKEKNEQAAQQNTEQKPQDSDGPSVIE